MEDIVTAISESVGRHLDAMWDLALDIYEHPEIGRKEFYASELLTKTLAGYGFAVDRGLADMPTSFKATYRNGTGGPTIGFLGEYDALMNLGHACGHHMQTPVCLGAALAIREVMKDEPYTLIIFGTPDEEINCGKGQMADAGVFDGVDIAINYHAGGRGDRVSYRNKANSKTRVTFHGIPAHASGAPQDGRSALDAMVLSFHGLEIMREHIRDGCRIHYTICEGTGPTNIVHTKAVAEYSLRALDKEYLSDMHDRFLNIIQGAALMTGTTYDVETFRTYYELLPVEALRDAMLDSMEAVGVPRLDRIKAPGGGSTDVGNVSWCVPTVFYQTFLVRSSAHSVAWLEAGKTEAARESMKWGMLAAAHLCCRLICDGALLARIREEWSQAKDSAEHDKATG